MSDTFPELAEVITELTQPNRINIIQAKRILLATLGDDLPNCPGSSFQVVSFMHVAVIGEVTPCRWAGGGEDQPPPASFWELAAVPGEGRAFGRSHHRIEHAAVEHDESRLPAAARCSW